MSPPTWWWGEKHKCKALCEYAAQVPWLPCDGSWVLTVSGDQAFPRKCQVDYLQVLLWRRGFIKCSNLGNREGAATGQVQRRGDKGQVVIPSALQSSNQVSTRLPNPWELWDLLPWARGHIQTTNQGAASLTFHNGAAEKWVSGKNTLCSGRGTLC